MLSHRSPSRMPVTISDDKEVVVAAVVDRGDDIGHVNRPRDHQRPLVDHAVVEGACPVVVRIAAVDQSPAQALPKFRHRFVSHRSLPYEMNAGLYWCTAVVVTRLGLSYSWGVRETLVTAHDAPDRLVAARRRTRRSASTSAPAAYSRRAARKATARPSS